MYVLSHDLPPHGVVADDDDVGIAKGDPRHPAPDQGFD